MPAPTIYYIRHGETSWNAEGKLQGAQDIPLNELGRKQAANAGSILADLFARDDRLREIGYGRWEGSTLAEMQAQDPELFAKRQTEKWTMSPPGGETYASVQLRMRDWYDSLKVDTVAVAHGGTARALMVALDIETPLSAADLTIEQGAVYVFSDGGLRKYS
jgi:broad specificity phosphatase PhoE